MIASSSTHFIPPSRLAQAFLFLSLVLVFARQTGSAQSYLRDWHNSNTRIKEVQPSWITPLAGNTPLLSQFVREEFVRQKMQNGDAVWNIGSCKGLSLLLSSRIEADFSVPNYVLHGDYEGKDGFGDFCVTTRYRILSGNKNHGNYSITAIGSHSWASGQAKNGAVSSTRGMTIAGGKAFGKFAALGTIGTTLPASSGLKTIGRPLVLNSAFEAHVAPRIWLQLESNSTFYNGGSHDGKKLNYMTPGIYLTPIRPWNEKSKTYILLGVGMQFATTHYHSTDHNLIVDTKVYF